MAIGRRSTAKARKKTAPKKPPPLKNDTHKCKIKLEDPSVLPDFKIELYWKEERQWWNLDKKTVLHEFRFTSDDGGVCIASWLVRKKVKCKWRRISEDNDYDDDENESDSDSESESNQNGAAMVPPKVQPAESGDGESVTSDEETPPDSWWDPSDDSDTDDDDGDKDYRPRASERQCNTRPCDTTEAIFGKNKIVKGRVYERHIGEDKWLVKVIEFTGEKFPVRRARCQTLFYLHAAIQDCFPHANPECIRQDRRWVFDESVRGKHFMETLTECHEDFGHLCQFVDFDLRRDKKDKLLIELRRRRLQETPQSMQSKQASVPKELVLFAGIGGCSAGDSEAGFEVSWLVENNQQAAASLKQNHPDATIYAEDVCLFLDKCDGGSHGYPSRDDVEHLQSSSPCQGFSQLNRGGKNDESNNLLSFQTVRATEIFRPKTGMLENVLGMLDSSNVHHAINIMQGLIDLHYQIRIAIHNSCNFGAPQKRPRVIFTFARGDVRLPDMPIRTHEEGSFITLNDAIQDLYDVPCDMTGSGLVRLPNDKLTYNHVASVPTKNAKPNKPGFLDKPVNTITTANPLTHPLQPNRTLSIRELARLFDLPDDKQFFGSLTSIRKQIGNSVPVKLAKAIAGPIIAVHEEFISIQACHGD